MQPTGFRSDWPHSIGPVMVYMANCNGACTTATPSSLNWVRMTPLSMCRARSNGSPRNQFKIDEMGLVSGTLTDGTWGQGELIANNNR